MVLDFKFKNKNNAVNLFNSKKVEIKQLINEFYYETINKSFSNKSSINTLLEKKYNFRLKLPSTMKVNKSNKDITWLSQLTIDKDQNGKHEIQQGLIIYEYDYVNEAQFSLKNQILFIELKMGK